MPLLNYPVQHSTPSRSDRRFHIAMGCICSSFIVLTVAAVWIVVAREPARRAAYLAQCQGTGFSAQQCASLYSERRRQETDNDAALAVAIGIAGSQAAMQYGRR